MGNKKTVEEMVEGLAISMKQGFERVDKRFDGVDKRFESVDKRFDGVDKRLDGIDSRFDAMDKKIDNKIDTLAIAVKHGFDDVDKHFENMDNKIDTLAVAVKQGFDDVADKFKNVEFQSSGLDPRVSILEKKVSIIGTKLGLQS